MNASGKQNNSEGKTPKDMRNGINKRNGKYARHVKAARARKR